VYDVPVEQMLDVLRAASVVALLVIRILRKGPSADRLRFERNVVAELAVKAGCVAQALRPSVVNLCLQSVVEAFLQDCLQRMVIRGSVRGRVPALSWQS